MKYVPQRPPASASVFHKFHAGLLTAAILVFLAATVMPPGQLSGAEPGASADEVPANPQLTKAARIVVPVISLKDVTLQQATGILAKMARELNKDGSISIVKSDLTDGNRATLEFNEVSLSFILKLVAEQTKTRLVEKPEGIGFIPGMGNAKAADPLRLRASAVYLGNLEFRGATVEEMVESVRKKSAARMTAEATPSSQELKVTVKDAGSGRYDLSLEGVSAWEALDQIAKVAGMHGAGTVHTSKGGFIQLDRSVMSVNVVADIYKTPEYKALERLQVNGSVPGGTLEQAVKQFVSDVSRASSGSIQLNLRVAPEIANKPMNMKGDKARASARFIALTHVTLYEWVKDRDGFLLRPVSKP